MEYCDTCKLDTNHGGYEFCPSETKAKLDAALLQFEEAREIIAEVSYSPEFKKWFYHGQEQDPCGVHAFTKKYAVKAEPAMVCLEGCPLPAGWDGSPKGCWVQHPLTREICQLAPDGHTIHERDDANGTRLLRWGPEKPKVERSPYAPNLDYPGKPVAEKPVGVCTCADCGCCCVVHPKVTVPEKRNDETERLIEAERRLMAEVRCDCGVPGCNKLYDHRK